MKRKPSKPESASTHARAAYRSLERLFSEPNNEHGFYQGLAEVDHALSALRSCRRSMVIDAIRDELTTQAELARFWKCSRAYVCKFVKDPTLF